jgi:two-component system NarL family sensor kinase
LFISMKIRHKIILLALVPLALAMLAIALSVRQQATSLSRQQYQALEQTYLASKEAELSHYVQLARTAIEPLYAERGNIPDAQARALATLARMDFGPDGYFFVYDLKGLSLMHPRQPELVGRDLWNLRDPEGAPTIQQLAEKARAGGGAVRYLWQKPSLERHVPKLGYVVPLPDWGWMLGSGIYLDDVDAALQRHDLQTKTYIEDTLVLIALIAAVCLMVVVGCGLVLNITEHKTSDAKLRRMAQQVVLSQETERARIARELHDGISQWLVSVKLLLESAIARMGTGTGPVPETLARAHGRLNGALGEIRRISHGLRPTMLDDLGLPAALSELAREAGDLTGVDVRIDVAGAPIALNDTAKTVLFRIAQEALTNVERHAAAQQIEVGLRYTRSGVQLWVADDGVGFDPAQVHQDPHRGLGLRNMRERLDSVGGELTVASEAGETRISAWIPLQHAVAEDAPAAGRPTDIEPAPAH